MTNPTQENNTKNLKKYVIASGFMDNVIELLNSVSSNGFPDDIKKTAQSFTSDIGSILNQEDKLKALGSAFVFLSDNYESLAKVIKAYYSANTDKTNSYENLQPYKNMEVEKNIERFNDDKQYAEESVFPTGI